MRSETIEFLNPSWPAPAKVQAVITTRKGGVSEGCYAGANFGLHVGDDPVAVRANREQLKLQTAIDDWQWLQQVHGTEVCVARRSSCSYVPRADATFTSQQRVVCAVMTADCLPVFICDAQGEEVAVVHAGWRGLAQGVLHSAIKHFRGPPGSLMVYLGPAISQKHFEVGSEVKTEFLTRFGLGAEGCFVPSGQSKQKCYADLYALARLALQQSGLQHIYGGGYCTYEDSTRFYSYRRESQTGRMVSAIWIG